MRTIELARDEAELLVDLLEPLALEGHYLAKPLRNEIASRFGMSVKVGTFKGVDVYARPSMGEA